MKNSGFKIISTFETVALLAILATAIALFGGTAVAANANQDCGALLVNAARTSKSKPTLDQVAAALALLPKEDREFFLVSDWGDPHSQLVTEDDPYEYKRLLSDSLSSPSREPSPSRASSPNTASSPNSAPSPPPAPFYNKENQRAGGIAAFQGHIFAEGYWRFANKSRREATRKQPWLKWDSTQKSYTIQRGHTARILLSPYSRAGKIKLYRGTQKQGLEFLKKIATGDLSGLTEDSFGYTDALFFTPDREIAATMWGTDGYVQIEITEEDLDAIYAGIEYNYVEVALSPAVLLRSISTLKVYSEAPSLAN